MSADQKPTFEQPTCACDATQRCACDATSMCACSATSPRVLATPVDSAEVTIRVATLQDVHGIYVLIRSNPRELIVRPMNNVVETIDRFSVAVLNGEIVGCACWQILAEIGNPEAATAELQSVAVKKELRGQQIGHKLVKFVLARIRQFNPVQALVLTFAPSFFGSLGFVPIDKRHIIHKIYRGCIYCTKHTDPFTCPEQAMALDLTQKDASL